MDQYLELHAHARDTLGPAGWARLSIYGKLMDGPDAGSYISGIDVEHARTLVDALAAGHVIPVHLMHRHASGNYEASSLCLRSGRLIMLFPNHSDFA